MGEHKNKKTRFIFISSMTIFFILLSIGLSLVVFQYYMNSTIEVLEDSEYEQYYVMITDDRKSSFWQSVYSGAYERGKDEDIYVEMLGDNLSTNYTKEELMQIAISSKVDGIIIASDESEDMTSLINMAANEEIPVITVYSDNTKSERLSFVGVGSYNLGREYGRQVLQISDSLKEEKKSVVQVLILVNANAKDSGQNILCSGIQETIEKENITELDINISLVSVDETNAFSVEESIRDIFMEEKLPDIIVCLNELNTTCVYQAVVDYNKVGTVNILGYYDSEAIIKAIDRNVIYATASINTEQMGSYCTQALSEYYRMGNISEYFTADITFINKENVSLYMGGRNGNIQKSQK